MQKVRNIYHLSLQKKFLTPGLEQTVVKIPEVHKLTNGKKLVFIINNLGQVVEGNI